MNVILAAILLAAAPPSFEAQTLDGQVLTGPLVELTSDRLTIGAVDGRVSLDTERLLSISAQKRPSPSGRLAAVVVELIDGSIVRGRQYTVQGTRAKITLSDDEALETPTSIVRTVQLQQESGAAGAEWARLVNRKVDSDLLVIRKDESLDYHQGVLHDVTEDTVRFDLDGELLSVKRSKVYGLVYHHSAETELPPTVCRITDATGSQWSAATIGLAETLPSPAGRGAGGEGGRVRDNSPAPLANRPHPNPLPAGEGTLRWTTPAGLSVAQSPERIVQIDFSGGKIVYLSDVKPERVHWTPYFDAGKPPAAVAQFYAPRYDRNFDGGPLQLDGKQYRKGLAVHSRTEIVYRLPDRFCRFRAMAGIDDAVRPGGKVRLIIRGDGRELLDATLAGKDAPRPVDLDLTGVRRLTIVVDFGESLGMGDYLLLCNARLSK
jgi:hypothetical protein